MKFIMAKNYDGDDIILNIDHITSIIVVNGQTKIKIINSEFYLLIQGTLEEWYRKIESCYPVNVPLTTRTY